MDMDMDMDMDSGRCGPLPVTTLVQPLHLRASGSGSAIGIACRLLLRLDFAAETL